MSDEISADNLINWFSYHPCKNEKIGNLHENTRDQCLELGKYILLNIPPSEERKIALQKLREVMMWSNAAISCNI